MQEQRAQTSTTAQEAKCTKTRPDAQGLAVWVKMLLGFQGARGISKFLWAAGSMSFAYKNITWYSIEFIDIDLLPSFSIWTQCELTPMTEPDTLCIKWHEFIASLPDMEQKLIGFSSFHTLRIYWYFKHHCKNKFYNCEEQRTLKWSTNFIFFIWVNVKTKHDIYLSKLKESAFTQMHQ